MMTHRTRMYLRPPRQCNNKAHWPAAAACARGVAATRSHLAHVKQHQQENSVGLAAGRLRNRARAGRNSERDKVPEPDSLEYDGPSAPDCACQNRHPEYTRVIPEWAQAELSLCRGYLFTVFSLFI